jgi:hypothetical protein
LNIVEIIRPQEPIPFIANFMLNNKKTMKSLDQYLKNLPKNEKELKEDEDNRIRTLIPEEEKEFETTENDEKPKI